MAGIAAVTRPEQHAAWRGQS